MVVGMSREICVDLYQAITQIRPEWHDEDPGSGQIKIVMTGSASDPLKMQPHLYSSQVKKRLEKRFKDPADELKMRSEEHTSELQSRGQIVCRLLREKKN